MYKHIIKRLLDIILGLVGMLFFIPVFIIVAPIIHFTDGGPIFFNGDRLGYKCKTFKMFKFRSMRVNAPDLRNADGSTFNSEEDPRVTKIGKILRKTSLDEIPQFINVLIGERGIIETTKNNADFSRVVTVNSISL